jgi:hypothetical protein
MVAVSDRIPDSGGEGQYGDSCKELARPLMEKSSSPFAVMLRHGVGSGAANLRSQSCRLLAMERPMMERSVAWEAGADDIEGKSHEAGRFWSKVPLHDKRAHPTKAFVFG